MDMVSASPGTNTVSRVEIGFPCASHVRNQGINQSKGKYIAFCDDDDIWFPEKIELQINAINYAHICI